MGQVTKPDHIDTETTDYYTVAITELSRSSFFTLGFFGDIVCSL